MAKVLRNLTRTQVTLAEGLTQHRRSTVLGTLCGGLTAPGVQAGWHWSQALKVSSEEEGERRAQR